MNNPNLVFAFNKGLIVVILFPDNVNFTKESTFFVLNNIFDKNLILVKFCLSILISKTLFFLNIFSINLLLLL